jgi:hypothetical protein
VLVSVGVTLVIAGAFFTLTTVFWIGAAFEGVGLAAWILGAFAIRRARAALEPKPGERAREVAEVFE